MKRVRVTNQSEFDKLANEVGNYVVIIDAGTEMITITSMQHRCEIVSGNVTLVNTRKRVNVTGNKSQIRQIGSRNVYYYGKSAGILIDESCAIFHNESTGTIGNKSIAFFFDKSQGNIFDSKAQFYNNSQCKNAFNSVVTGRDAAIIRQADRSVVLLKEEAELLYCSASNVSVIDHKNSAKSRIAINGDNCVYTNSETLINVFGQRNQIANSEKDVVGVCQMYSDNNIINARIDKFDILTHHALNFHYNIY